MNSTLSPQELYQLESQGYVSVQIENHPLINCAALKSISAKLYAEKFFKTASIGSSSQKDQFLEIRNDFTLWISEETLPPSLSSQEQREIDNYVLFINQIRQSLKDYFRAGLNYFETHFAIFPPGHFYKKHIDQTAQNNRRHMSFVVYLNENWAATDGGNLVGYQQEKIIFNIEPKMGTMILFLSSIEHEVLLAKRERYSITGWFRNE